MDRGERKEPMRIRISGDLILVVGLVLGYVCCVLGTGNQQPIAVGVVAAAMLLCAGVLAGRRDEQL